VKQGELGQGTEGTITCARLSKDEAHNVAAAVRPQRLQIRTRVRGSDHNTLHQTAVKSRSDTKEQAARFDVLIPLAVSTLGYLFF